MKTLLTCLFALFSLSLIAQPAIEWDKTIGGDSIDWLNSLQQTTDGGYILGGYSVSDISGDKTESNRGGDDYWVVKLDANGIVQWNKTIGGNFKDWLLHLQETSDGGYILGGQSQSDISGDKTENSKGGADYWVVKLDSTGVIQWDKTIGGNNYDHLSKIRQTPDGGYILGGYSASDISGDKTEDSEGEDWWVVKLDASGTVQWDKTIGGASTDWLFELQQTTDGGYILGGHSESDSSGDKTENSKGLYDYWVVKLDSTGAIQWDKTIGGDDWDFFRGLQLTSDGGYILGGSSYSDISGDKTENSKGGRDYWVVKLDSAGLVQWDKTVGGGSNAVFANLQLTSDGGYLLGGNSKSDISGDKTENSKGEDDYWVVKLDSTGTIEWDKTIGGDGWDLLSSLQLTNDEGYILGGYSWSDMSGDKTENSNGEYDYWVVKLAPDWPAGITNISVLQNQTEIYPNPTSNKLWVKGEFTGPLTITDITGKRVLHTTLKPNEPIDVSTLGAGLYILSAPGISAQKFIKN